MDRIARWLAALGVLVLGVRSLAWRRRGRQHAGMAAPDQFFASGYPMASAAAGIRALADVASRLPRVEPAALHAFASAVSSPDFAPRVEPAALRPALIAFASAVSPMPEPADFAPAPAKVPLPHVTLVPPGGMTMEAPSTHDASRRKRLKRNAAAVAFAWLYLAVPAETVDRAAGWATVIALFVLLHDRHK